MSIVMGVGKDAPIITNKSGGKQSAVNYRFDLIDTDAIFELTKILSEGANKYGEWNWKKINRQDHINHALIHLYAYMAGDTQDDHLGHAFCRIMFALGTEDNQ